MPEVVNFLALTILLLAPHGFATPAAYPGSFPLTEIDSARYAPLKLKSKSTLAPSTPDLAALLTAGDDDVAGAEANLGELASTPSPRSLDPPSSSSRASPSRSSARRSGCVALPVLARLTLASRTTVDAHCPFLCLVSATDRKRTLRRCRRCRTSSGCTFRPAGRSGCRSTSRSRFLRTCPSSRARTTRPASNTTRTSSATTWPSSARSSRRRRRARSASSARTPVSSRPSATASRTRRTRPVRPLAAPPLPPGLTD
jgi:hypothetical protein